jgi:hypothetical protein
VRNMSERRKSTKDSKMSERKIGKERKYEYQMSVF